MRKVSSLFLILGPLFLLAAVKPWLGPHFLSEDFFMAFAAVLTVFAVGGSFLWNKIDGAELKDELQKRFNATFETDNLGFIFSNPEGKIIEANDYFLRMIGYTREEMKLGLIDWRKITAP
jgi:PAS domain-containing protein